MVSKKEDIKAIKAQASEDRKDIEAIEVRADKDRDELRQTVAQLLADSIVGKVETILIAGLTAKVTHAQEAQVVAERARDEAMARLTDIESRNVKSQQAHQDLSHQLTIMRTNFDERKARYENEEKVLLEKLAFLRREAEATEKKLNDEVAQAKAEGEAEKRRIRAAVDAETTTFNNIKEQHTAFRKSIGLE